MRDATDRGDAALPPEFDRDAALARLPDGTWQGVAPPSWCGATGRPQGGFLAAQLMLAMQEAMDDPARQPRSISVHLVRGPSADPYAIDCTVERTGRTVSNTSARLVQDGKLQAVALATFATARAGPEFDEAPLPTVPPATPTRATEAVVPPFALPFAERVVVQQREGERPFAGTGGPMHIGGWLGMADPRPIDAAGLLVLCDATIMPWWVRLSDPVPTATVDYTLHFRGDLPRSTEHELVYGQFTTRLVRGGFLDWDGVVWAPDGTVLCLARQQLVTLGG